NVNGNYPENCSREKVILNVGRLIKSKRIDLLIRYFKEINPNDWKSWLVRAGPVRLELESLVKVKNLQDSIVFRGTRQDVEIFYERSSIFAFTSESEGFPNALLEAMSYGLPVISFDCNAGPRDLIINNENGFLINLKDDDEYINKLKLLIYDPILRAKFGENSKKISANFDVSIIGKKYLVVLLK